MPCGVCGVEHPHLTICPYVLETEQREQYEWRGDDRRILVRVVRTRYAPRAELIEAILSATDGAERTASDGAGAALPGGDGDTAIGWGPDSKGHEPYSPGAEQSGLAVDRS